MRPHHAVTTAIFLYGCGIPTSTSFYFSPPSCTKIPRAPNHDGINLLHVPPSNIYTGPRRFGLRRPKRPTNSVAGLASSTKLYTGDNFESLTRSELQALCKEKKIRAVGKTLELVKRLQQHTDITINNSSQDPTAPTTTSLPQEQENTTLGDEAKTTPSSPLDTPTTPSEVVELAPQFLLDDVRPEKKIRAAGKTLEPVKKLQQHSTITINNSWQDQTAPTTTSLPQAQENTTLGDEAKTTPASPRDAPSTPNKVVELAPEFSLDDVRPVFEELSDEQWMKVGQLGQLLTEWNVKVNLISRKDIENVMKRHVIPCLTMAKALNLEDGSEVLDVGTGGGLPGLPLAIFYPDVRFTLIDGTGKKILAARHMAKKMGLRNVRAVHMRAENVDERFDFVVGRGVTSLPKFVGFTENLLKANPPSSASDSSSSGEKLGKGGARLKRGILYMRGKIAEEELEELGARPLTAISLEHILKGGKSSDSAAAGGGGEEVSDRGYSSVFHFTSEDIWNRTPLISQEEDTQYY